MESVSITRCNKQHVACENVIQFKVNVYIAERLFNRIVDILN